MIKNDKTYHVGNKRVFMSYFKGVYSIYEGEGYALNEKVREYTNRFDAVCHVESVIHAGR